MKNQTGDPVLVVLSTGNFMDKWKHDLLLLGTGDTLMMRIVSSQEGRHHPSAGSIPATSPNVSVGGAAA